MWFIVFDQLLNAFSGRKTISRGYWGWQIFIWKFWVRGLTFSCENGKSGGVGGGTTEIPSLVGVWIFSGNTHSCKMSDNFEFRNIL